MTTPECNLCCSYCGGRLHGMPSDITYDDKLLRRLIKKDPHAVVAFYGGEPVLRPKVIKRLLQLLPAKHFVINTNGYFIQRIADVLSDFDTILLSVDGREQTTDAYRGKGCYQQVMRAYDFIQDSSFEGELVARMTASKNTDIYKDVNHLLGFFSFVHWQLDVVWSTEWNVSEFMRWVKTSYTYGLKKLIIEWVQGVKERRIIGIIPFRGIMTRLLYERKGLGCQSGDKSFTITTDGRILACPIALDYEWNKLGSIVTGFNHISVDEPCPSCKVYSVCGGRCLFSNKERLWGNEGFSAICDMTKFLIHELEQYVPICERLKEKIYYPVFNNTTEIIP